MTNEQKRALESSIPNWCSFDVRHSDFVIRSLIDASRRLILPVLSEAG
jgi:hypothetical protein